MRWRKNPKGPGCRHYNSAMAYFALVPAAGSGSRMGAVAPKQYLPLAGRTVIEHALADEWGGYGQLDSGGVSANVFSLLMGRPAETHPMGELSEARFESIISVVSSGRPDGQRGLVISAIKEAVFASRVVSLRSRPVRSQSAVEDSLSGDRLDAIATETPSTR